MTPTTEDLPLFGDPDELETYEIHITVKGGDIDVKKFKRDCADIDVKPLVVQLRGGQIPNDVMTSSTVKCTPARLKALCVTQVVQLMERGWEPTRCKIECSPWHNAIADIRPNQIKPWQYFESHIPVNVSSHDDIGCLRALCRLLDMHLSANAFKVTDRSRTIMVTYRSADYDALEFRKQVMDRVGMITEALYDAQPPVVEFALFDSNRDHDNTWLGI